MQYRSTNPEGKTRGMGVSIYTAYKARDCSITIFYPIPSLDTVNMFLALKNCMNVCPQPQELYSSKHMEKSPTRRDCITYTVP